jgi:6,7-dimethyl-8-ribityllumazine synthase
MAEVTNSNLYEDAGILDTQDACVVIVRTEWNARFVDELEAGCRKALAARKVTNITTAKYWNHRPCCFIALGCVIQGGTPHFEYVCQSVTQGVTQLNLTLPVPVIFGVLTVNNEQQALERLGGPHGHKGEEAAITALKMAGLQKSLRVNHP